MSRRNEAPATYTVRPLGLTVAVTYGNSMSIRIGPVSSESGPEHYDGLLPEKDADGNILINGMALDQAG